MMKVLGVRRVMLLAILIGMNALFAAILYGYMIPESAKKERELRGLRSQVSTIQADISRMQVEFDQLDSQRERFENLRESGFFIDQERRQAEDLFDLLQQRTNVISAKASISAGKVEDNEEAEKAGHKVLSSPVKIEIEAIDDTDVYRYIYLLEQFFPGHIDITNLSIRRYLDLNGAVLRSISAGTNPPLMRAEVDLAWRTMIPEDQVINEGGN